MRLLLGIILFFSTSFAYIQVTDDYDTQLKILKEFDIEPEYMADKHFLLIQQRDAKKNRKYVLHAFKEYSEKISRLKKTIQDYKIPKSFLYVAIVESGLSDHATSDASAVGVWQLMPKTADLLGLKVNRYIDERRDDIESTKAALKYLSTLKKRFGSWYLAFMAYNCGEGRLSKAISEAGSKKLGVLMDPDKKYIPQETRFFIYKILLTAKFAHNVNYMISNDSYVFNNPTLNNVAKVEIPGGTTLDAVAHAVEMNQKEIKKLNPHITHGLIPTSMKRYFVYVPLDKEKLFHKNYIPDVAPTINFYKVRKGDTLSSIAAKYKIKVSDITRYNRNLNSVKEDMEIGVPLASTLNKRVESYIVKKGDTLYGIARKFDIKVNDLKEANSLSNANLKIGDRIVIPE